MERYSIHVKKIWRCLGAREVVRAGARAHVTAPPSLRAARRAPHTPAAARAL